MAYSAADVKNLRETTGAGMMDCKKALDECAGDFQKAVDFLRAKGLAAAAKKQSRVATEGMIVAQVQGKKGVLVEVNSETDFAAKSPDFVNFVATAGTTAISSSAKNVEELLSTKAASGSTLKDMISELTIKIGEKIDVRRYSVVTLDGHGTIGSYVHSGKIGVLCKLETDKDVSGNEAFKDLAKDLCMQIAAANPQFLDGSAIDETFKAREAEVYAAQLREQGKAEAMIPNIVKGKLNKLATEVCLMEQAFVKDPDMNITKLVESVSKTVGATIKVTQFVKLALGEGLEKKEDNFAEEVAKMTSGAN